MRTITPAAPLSPLIVSLAAACSSTEGVEAPLVGARAAPPGYPVTCERIPGANPRECADKWLGTYQACAVSVTPETPSEEAVAAVARCWQTKAKEAFDACCAADPDLSCENDGMDWPRAPGARSCALAMSDSFDACIADISLSLGDANLTNEQINAVDYCWGYALAADDRCCAADPIRCDTDDIKENDCRQTSWQPDESCATALFQGSDRCLADANASTCDWRPEALAVQEQCWQEGLAAKAACCADRPDWACGDGAQSELRAAAAPAPVERQCADKWFGTYERCVANAGVSEVTCSRDAVEISIRCSEVDAKQEFDRCCAASPDESCQNDGMDWPLPLGVESCAPELLAAYDRCLAATGVSDDGSTWTEEREVMLYCWSAEAQAVSQACCAGDAVRCDTDDIVGGACDRPIEPRSESCAATLLETSNQCLSDARVSKCDWRKDAQEVRAYCWDQGVSAKDACCATRPDGSCD